MAAWGEFRQNWLALLGATAAVGTGASMFTYTANFLVVPLETAEGWSRSQVAFGATLFMFANALMMPVIGILTGRYGARRVGVTCMAAFGSLACLLALLPASLSVYYSTILTLALFGAGVNGVVFGPVIAERFRRRRGLALSIMLSGSALLLIPIAPALSFAISEFGWRAGYAALGTMALLIGLPGALAASRAQTARPEESARAGGGLCDAIRTAAYWKIIFGVVFSALPLGGFLNQMSPLLISRGLSGTHAALLTSLFVSMVLVGRIGVGALLDLLRASLVSMSVMLVAAAAVSLLLLQAPSIVLCGIVVAALGAAMGAEGDIQAYLLARHFDLHSFAALFGTSAMCTTMGFGLGALMFGTLYDWYGNYIIAVVLSMLSFGIAGFFFGSLALGPSDKSSLEGV